MPLPHHTDKSYSIRSRDRICVSQPADILGRYLEEDVQKKDVEVLEVVYVYMHVLWGFI